MIIRENRELDESQKRSVLELVRERGVACESCGSHDFAVGEALELGRLWHNEEHGMYMVALRCEVPDCNVSTGIRLRRTEFLDGG